MAFQPPTFNLAVAIWHSPFPAYAFPSLVTMGNLAYSRRIAALIPVGITTPSLLVPALTDIRAAFNGVPEDVIEVPAGSKRFYAVESVDDAGKGFANEHRVASLAQIVTGFFGFPLPVPLP